MDKYISIQIGDKAELRHTITQKDLNQFVELTGDDNKIHVDENYASSTSFKKPVVHGMLGASFISTIIGTKLPGDGALWYAQNLEFLQPVRIGDELFIKAKVIQKIDRSKTIELQTDIYNQYKQKVTTGTAKVKLVDLIVSKEDTEQFKSKKAALIIGGTGGIGIATCLQLAEDGFDIIIHYFKNKSKANMLKESIEKIGRNVTIISGDITLPADVNEIKEKALRFFSQIPVIVNCSTIPVRNIKFSNLEWDDMLSHYQANIRGSFNLLRSFVPIWEKDSFGKFIGITTLYTEQPKSELLSYITGKSALNGFVKALAYELAPKGIRLNLVSPGMVDTPLIADVPEKVRLLAAAQTPLRALASPEDIAGVISFLASKNANYLTGETIRVNGGQSMI